MSKILAGILLVTVVLGLVGSGCADDRRGAVDDAGALGGSGAAGGAGAAGAAGSGGTGGTAGVGGQSGGSPDAGVDASAGVGGSCPPCVPPPSPDCVGTGPCGCGPYECPDAGGSSYDLQCDSTGGPFPAFSKSCGDEGDCVVLAHQTDCCGNAMMVGVAASSRAGFESAEAQCSSTFPLCDCPSQPPAAEDGTRAVDADAFTAECQSGECSSTVDPARISQSDLALCQQDSDCVVVPYDHCCGATKSAINQRYLDVYNDHPEWQSFNDPATCAVIGICPDDSAIDTALCQGSPLGTCQLDFN